MRRKRGVRNTVKSRFNCWWKYWVFLKFNAALLGAKSCRVSQWTADTVDEILILIEGDTMYVPIQKPCCWRIYLIEYIGLRLLRIELNQIHCPLLQLYVYNQVFKKLLSTYERKPDLKVASEDQIIEALLSLANMKIAYDAIKVLELMKNVKIVYFDTESMNFINVLLESAKQKAILNSWKAWR